jgi:integrase
MAGRQFQRVIGPAWKGKAADCPPGHFTRKTAQAALAAILEDARRAAIPDHERTDVTFAEAAEAWYESRARKGCRPSTLRGYRSALDKHLIPAFGPAPLTEVTARRLQLWLDGVGGANRTRQRLGVIRFGVFRFAGKRYGLKVNPVADVELPEVARKVDVAVYTVEELHALARAAASELDRAMYLTAAYSGLRLGEQLALRWRDVDFALEAVRVERSHVMGHLGPTKGGDRRVVPLAPQLAEVLAPLVRRERWIGPDDLVFTLTGSYLDATAVGRRYAVAVARAGLERRTYHALRHTFCSLAIQRATPEQVRVWAGHADLATTARYLHFRPQGDEAARLAAAFALPDPAEPVALPR